MRPAPLYDQQYIDNYDSNNGRKTLAGKFMQQGHVVLEKILPPDFQAKDILEVGAGTGHHIGFVKPGYDRYVMTDGHDLMLEIARKNHAEALDTGKFIIEKQDATALSYADNSFDRLIATHVLEHIPDPVKTLAEWNRVVKPGGIISILLPCDPGILWRFGRTLGPRRTAIAQGMPYDYMQATEHVNAIFNLVVIIRHHFTILSENFYPAMVPLPDINLFYSCHLRVDDK